MLEHIYKILLSILLSTLVGLDREKEDKPAGLRTVALVCLGATLFSILALELIGIAGIVRYDVGRIFAYTIAGIGFLGSGVIIHNKGDVEGITTAALLWVMVAVGLFCGIGKFILAIISTLFIYIILKSKRLNGRKDND